MTLAQVLSLEKVMINMTRVSEVVKIHHPCHAHDNTSGNMRHNLYTVVDKQTRLCHEETSKENE